MAKREPIALIITSAVIIDGEITPASDKPIELDYKTAKNLLHRGKAELATNGEKPLEEHTVKELKEILDDYGVEYDGKANKADLIELVKIAEDDEGE